MKTAALSFLIGLTTAATAAAQDIAFVTCPIYRDTDAGKKSGCWLAESPESGVRYDITQSANKPDWNHAVLVEGRLGEDQTDLCGGVVLAPVRVSVLPEPCVRAMLPAEEFAGRRFVLPPRNVRPLYAARTPAAAPWSTRDFSIPFDFDRDFVVYQNADYLLDQAVSYALDVEAERVEITGLFDDRAREISGTAVQETEEIARLRAERVADWMRLRGVPADRIHLSWRAAASGSDDPAFEGLTEASRRRADIRIVPSQSQDRYAP